MLKSLLVVVIVVLFLWYTSKDIMQYAPYSPCRFLARIDDQFEMRPSLIRINNQIDTVGKCGGEDRVSSSEFQRMCARSPISPFPSSHKNQ